MKLLCPIIKFEEKSSGGLFDITETSFSFPTQFTLTCYHKSVILIVRVLGFGFKKRWDIHDI